MSVFESRLALQPADQVVPTIPFSIVASDTDGMNYGQSTESQVQVSDTDGMNQYQDGERQE